jgi:cytochrome c oxidase subunit II
MMGGFGSLACASCHGPDGRGRVHNIGMMREIDAKDIRWKTLEDEFDTEKFRLAVKEGKDPDGTQMWTDMPRWMMSDGDIADLIDYLKTLP